jgi:hypothetical protein
MSINRNLYAAEIKTLTGERVTVRIECDNSSHARQPLTLKRCRLDRAQHRRSVDRRFASEVVVLSTGWIDQRVRIALICNTRPFYSDWSLGAQMRSVAGTRNA